MQRQKLSLLGCKYGLFKYLALLIVFCLVFGPAIPTWAAGGDKAARMKVKEAGTGQAGYVPGEVIVKFKETVSVAEAKKQLFSSHKSLGLSEKKGLKKGVTLFKTSADVPSALAALENDPRVEYAQPNYIYRIFTGDPLWEQQWGLTDAVYGVQAADSWDYTRGSSDIVVAVIDTGVDGSHEDLAANLVPGYDFVNDDGDPDDDNGHGTHVAGIIAAAADNGKGIAGTAPNVKIMPLKAADAGGSFTTASIVSAIQYAADNGARVVNMSFGSSNFDTLEYEAIRDNPGILFVAAAGNEGNNNDVNPVYPACYDLPNIISVAALAPDGGLAGFSNYGEDSVHLAAPGGDIISAIPQHEGSGVALAVYDESHGYKTMLWGFGAEDLAVDDYVYDSVVRTVYHFFGINPGEKVLVVDDDQSGTYGDIFLPDVSGLYLDALSTAGYVYDLHEVPNNSDGPVLNPGNYSAVIWFTGQAWGSDPPYFNVPNFTDNDRVNLINYLQNGGKLFISGRDAAWGIEESSFYKQYLKADFEAEFIDMFKGVTIKGSSEPFEGTEYRFGDDYGSYIDLIRPASQDAEIVLQAYPYISWSGTSMAAPFVSGGAALALSLKNSLEPGEVIDILTSNVTKLDSLSGLVSSGGTLNIARALAYIDSMDTPVTGGGAGGGGGGGGGGGSLPAAEAEVPETASGVINVTGEEQSFTVLEGGVSMDVPAGALPEGAAITVQKVADVPEQAPEGAAAVSPVISFESSAVPAKPVRVSIRYDEQKLGGIDPRVLMVYRQNDDGSWAPVGGRLDRASGAVVVELSSFSNYAVFGVSKSFSDTFGHWAEEDIGLLAGRGIIKGTGAGIFEPGRSVSRAELAALLVRLLDLEPAKPGQFTFKDVARSSWYYEAVETAVKNGIIKGYGDGTFRPDETVTREQLAVMLANIIGTAAGTGAPEFEDAEEISPWAREGVAAASVTGLMRGVSEAAFAPKEPVSRAQAAAILARLAERMGIFEVMTAVTGTVVWSTVEKPHWELKAEDRTYVLLPDAADKMTPALLKKYEGQRVKASGYLDTGPNIYMRGPVLRVVNVEKAE